MYLERVFAGLAGCWTAMATPAGPRTWVSVEEAHGVTLASCGLQAAACPLCQSVLCTLHTAVTVTMSEHPSTAGLSHLCFICVTCPREGTEGVSSLASRCPRGHVDPCGCFPRVLTLTVSDAGLL
jgi:hypothetical protein